jgi:anti-sigma factor RsiW
MTSPTILPRIRFARGTRSIAHGHVSDAQLSDVLDEYMAGDERATIEAHLAGCPACAERRRGLEAVIALGTLEHATTRLGPDQWPIIAACTVHERRLQRFFARRRRRRTYAWILFAALSGILLSEGLRQVSAVIARAGAWIAAEARSYTPPLSQLRHIRGGTPPPATK